QRLPGAHVQFVVFARGGGRPGRGPALRPLPAGRHRRRANPTTPRCRLARPLASRGTGQREALFVGEQRRRGVGCRAVRHPKSPGASLVRGLSSPPMHILQLCPRVPYPPHDGGAMAMYETARGLAEAGHRVTILAANTPKHHQPADALAHLGPNVRLVTVDVDTRIRPLAALRNLVVGTYPYNVERFISQELAETLKQLLLSGEIDILQLEGALVAWYAMFITIEIFGPPRTGRLSPQSPPATT
nr:hypothetical protein [Tanacetum cinerariifolium]